MLKKNQLALILLTLVMMLTVYYIKSPFGSDKPKDDDDITDVTGRLEQLSLKRLTIKNSRKELIVELDAIIASDEATVSQKNAAINEKQFLNTLTEKELLLELEFINKGYQDAFVHATKDLVTVTIVADEHSLSLAEKYIMETLVEFDGIANKVSVTFQTVQEVMGQVTEGN